MGTCMRSSVRSATRSVPSFAGSVLSLLCTFSVPVGQAMSSSPLLDAFCGKYFFNNDQSMNFVAAAKFSSDKEKNEMLDLFRHVDDPKPRRDLPALKIMMRRPQSNELFVHDTLYNIEVTDDPGNGKMLMHCWTGDMQLTLQGKVSNNQAKGKT